MGFGIDIRSPLRICIDARIVPGNAGGTLQVILGLADALSKLSDGPEEYLFLALPGGEDWLRPHLAGSCSLLPSRKDRKESPRLRTRLAERLPRLARSYAALAEQLLPPPILASDGTIESAKVDLVHFTVQHAFKTHVPSIYHPHDLQFVHLPQFFSRAERRRREALWGAMCRQAAMVAVGSKWVKHDVVSHFGLDPAKVEIVPLAPGDDHSAAEPLETQRRFGLPDKFALYPAQTWPHKNHRRLLDAVASIRARHSYTIPIVCPGQLHPFHEEVREHARKLGLQESLHFLGFVSQGDLRSLYALARCVVIPTLFEAGSFPLFEAFRYGVPAACSNVTSLPEQAGDAALLFDPTDIHGMADALHAVWSDEQLRRKLVERGRARVSQFTWDRTARIFRAHYRRLGGRPLSEEDVALLRAPPLY
jgi:glycosyltransferase involved in cell wall biosynthesis